MNIGMSLRSIGKKLLKITRQRDYPPAFMLPKDSDTVKLWEQRLGVKSEKFRQKMGELVAEAEGRTEKYKAGQRRERMRAIRRRGNQGSIKAKQAKSAAGLARRKARPGWLNNRANHLGRKAVRSKGVA